MGECDAVGGGGAMAGNRALPLSVSYPDSLPAWIIPLKCFHTIKGVDAWSDLG